MDDNQRPWPRPRRSWVMTQSWHHIIFMHWPVEEAVLRPLVPRALAIETHDGSAWISLIAFAVRRARPLFLPALPGLSSFPQLNVRTYVRHSDRPGVFFLSANVGSRLAAALAGIVFHLPLRHARMKLWYEGWEWAIGCRSDAGSFTARYASEGAEFLPAPGSLEHWLVERFCFYATSRSGRIRRGEIDHAPWELVPAKVRVTENRWAEGFGTALREPPALAHYCSRQRAYVWRPERIA